MEKIPAGIRNKNPLNVKNNPKNPWRGSTGQDVHNHAIFESNAWGLRAAILNLRSYYLKHNLRSVAAILSRWAPSSDSIGSIPGAPPNSPEEYTLFVCERLGVGPNSDLDLFKEDGEIDSEAMLRWLLRAMAAYECGSKYVLPEEDVTAALLLI